MSFEFTEVFKKDNLDFYLKELAKEYRRLIGSKMPAEIILVGGAAVLANYSFRDMTTDIDAIIHAASAINDAIKSVRDRFNLPNGWLNTDFYKTGSFSNQLIQYSTFYKSFYRVLNVRIITGEYLLAMKLRAYRAYKNDISDIVGILVEHERKGSPITLEQVDIAVIRLYGSWIDFPDGAHDFITNILTTGKYEKLYKQITENEKETKELLIDFQEENPGELRKENLDEVLKRLRDKKQGNDTLTE